MSIIETHYFPRIGMRLQRDQARAIQEKFFPYLTMLCETKAADAVSIEQQHYCKLVTCIYAELQVMFERKLLTAGSSFKINMTFPQAYILYCLLMEMPIPGREFWLQNLRRSITDFLDKQINQP